MRNEELQKLTEIIEKAVESRYYWMLAHLSELTEFEIGDPIFATVASSGYKLQRAGIVNRIYLSRPKGSDMPQVCYEFDPHPSYHYSTNTEGRMFSSFYGKEAWDREKRMELQRIQKEIE